MALLVTISRIDVFANRNLLSYRGARVAQLVKRPTSAQINDLMAREFTPRIGLSAVSAEPALVPVSLSLCTSPARALSHLKKKKKSKKTLKKLIVLWKLGI